MAVAMLRESGSKVHRSFMYCSLRLWYVFGSMRGVLRLGRPSAAELMNTLPPILVFGDFVYGSDQLNSGDCWRLNAALMCDQC